jgi:hypothetical protein
MKRLCHTISNEKKPLLWSSNSTFRRRFTGGFPQILRLLQRSSLPIQPSFRSHAVWCVSYQTLSRSWYIDLDLYRLPDLETGLMPGVTGWQGMFTPYKKLIPSLVYPEVRVCLILLSAFPTELMRLMTVRYLCHFIYVLFGHGYYMYL